MQLLIQLHLPRVPRAQHRKALAHCGGFRSMVVVVVVIWWWSLFALLARQER